MGSYFIVFVGAGLGGALRHGVNIGTARLLGPGLPYGTLAVNILGSLTMGVLAGWFALRGSSSQSWRLFLTTGLLGGFTTFSTFSLDAVSIWERGQGVEAALYVLVSVLFALLGLVGGLILMRHAL
jgi:CrcB protein